MLESQLAEAQTWEWLLERLSAEAQTWERLLERLSVEAQRWGRLSEQPSVQARTWGLRSVEARWFVAVQALNLLSGQIVLLLLLRSSEKSRYRPPPARYNRDSRNHCQPESFPRFHHNCSPMLMNYFCFQ